MAVSQTSDDFVLPCGRGLDALWDGVEAGTAGEPGSHEHDCPHCQTAVASLTTLREATRELAAEPVRVPDRLTGRIMSAVRAEVRRSRTVPLPAPGQGPGDRAEISEQAVAVVLRFAADSIDGIRARRCTVRLHGEETRGDGEHESDAVPGLVDVEMTLAIRYGTGPADDVLAAVRRALAAAADAGIGLRIARCDLYVEDIYQ
jgi:hypothetical protein